MILTKDIIWRLGNTSSNNENKTIHFISDNKWNDIWTITANAYYNDNGAAIRLYYLSYKARDIDSLSEYYDRYSYSIFDNINWETNSIHKLSL